MSIQAASLIARVSVEGVDSSSAKLAAMGGVVRATESTFATLGRGFGNIAFGLRNLGTAGTIGMDALRQGAVQVGGALLKIAAVAGLVGAAIAVGVGVLAVRAAGDFQQGLNRLVTGAGDVTDNMAKMGQSILATSIDSGVLTSQLLPAMYQIISAGQRGALAQNTLAVAARGSVTEQAKVVDVAKALTTAMTDYGTRQFNATQFMNGYTRATQLGKITLEELATSMGPILPLAQNIGLKFADVAAAMSTMTNAGIPAARAATSLRFLFQSLENPTHKAQTAMTEFGLSSIKLGNELKVSLPGALQMVFDAAKKAGPEGSVPFNRAVSDMIGGQRSLQAYLALTGTHLSTFKSNAQAISGAMTASRTAVLGWSTAQGNFNVQLDRAKAAGQALLITIGTALLPGLTNIARAVTPIIVAFTQWVVQSHAVENVMHVLVTAITGVINIVSTVVGWLQKHEAAMDAVKGVAIVLAGIIAGAMVAALVAYTIAAWSAAAATLAWAWPFLLIGAIVALVVAGIILAITHWGAIMHWIQEVISAVGTFIRDRLTWIKNTVGEIFSAIGTFIRDRLTWIKNTVGDIFNAIGTKIHDALLGAANFIHGKITDIENFFKALPGKITAALATLGAILLAPFKWFYDHNYYVKAAVDAMVKDFTNLKTKVGEIFSAIGTFIHDRLTWIKNTVGTIFSDIGTFIHDKLTWIKNQVGQIFDTIGSWIHDKLTAAKNTVGSIFSSIGTTIHDKLTGAKNDAGNIFDSLGTSVRNKITDLKNAVGSSFQAMGTLMHQKLVDAWNNLVSFASGWPAAAFQWGVSMIQGLINGIGSMLGGLANIAGQVAGQMKKMLGFHQSEFGTPEDGPAKDADKWMPALIAGMSNQLIGGQSKMKTALGSLISPLSTQLSVSANASLGGLGGLSSLGSPGLSPAYARVAVTGNGQATVINVQPAPIILDGVRVSQQLMPHIANRFRYGAGITI